MEDEEKLTFECREENEEYEATGRWYDDGAGYWDVKATCPHCGEHHWRTVRL